MGRLNYASAVRRSGGWKVTIWQDAHKPTAAAHPLLTGAPFPGGAKWKHWVRRAAPVPDTPFRLSWYQGGQESTKHGVAGSTYGWFPGETSISLGGRPLRTIES